MTTRRLAFTLVEIALCLAVMAAVSLIAWQSYQAYVDQAAKSTAMSHLDTVLALQEREWATTGRYEDDPVILDKLQTGLAFTAVDATQEGVVSVSAAGDPPSLGLAAYVPRSQACVTLRVSAPGDRPTQDEFAAVGGAGCSGSAAGP